MVLVQFEVVLHCFDWFGLVLKNFGIKKIMMSKNFQNPIFCFSYKLGYSHPN